MLSEVFLLVCILSLSKQEILEMKNQRDSESKKVVETLQKAEVDKQKEKSKIFCELCPSITHFHGYFYF